MEPNPLPKYVYKIIPSAPPEPIPQEYPLSELDQKDGFVHLSTATQIPITSDLFFSDTSVIWVIKLGFEKFAPLSKWEIEGCPHLYGNFGADDVVSVQKFERDPGQKWTDAMKKSKWLE